MEITAQLVRDLVAAQFPEWAGCAIEPVVRQGHDNRTFRLGEGMSVRLPSDEAYAAAVVKEARCLPLLSAQLAVAVPDVLATGAPATAFPLPWSVRRWVDGDTLADGPAIDRHGLAEDLGRFLRELRSVPAADGPPAGRHSFFRGCHPRVYADEVERALAALGDRVDGSACRRVWATAMRTAWQRDPVWFHGDVAEGNLLVRERRLAAVIDFGTCGIGDPACDLVMAWTFFGDAERDTFRSAVGLDRETWDRARGWALWKELITLAADGLARTDEARTLAAVLSDRP